ncbi:E3 ubiquitin-protein ligase BRE1-like [Gossypium australe]|uniref:E3 ubiquitin-protein ligase BRE1-like n=1 Tax=Gossypium australe TaxID=47621 RepID=A0A5B6WIC7_9ROSI|nr:E3 ubiquitin-protein ligase BRE1-like [Gossypium australe]
MYIWLRPEWPNIFDITVTLEGSGISQRRSLPRACLHACHYCAPARPTCLCTPRPRLPYLNLETDKNQPNTHPYGTIRKTKAMDKRLERLEQMQKEMQEQMQAQMQEQLVKIQQDMMDKMMES